MQVNELIKEQFPQWADLPVTPVATSGWDNRTFHLGSDKLIRLPSAKEYEAQVDKEQYWLPQLAPLLPLSIPKPLALGRPSRFYPWKWSVYKLIPGKDAASINIKDLNIIAGKLADFLLALHCIDIKNAPMPGEHNFYRGGALNTYDLQTRQALNTLKNIDKAKAIKLWDEAIHTAREDQPVWIHGDISPGNLLIEADKLSAVIDFGLMAVGDPACDLAIAWTFFNKSSRELFQKKLNLDKNTWHRGQAWALWKGAIIASGMSNSNIVEKKQAHSTLEAILNDV